MSLSLTFPRRFPAPAARSWLAAFATRERGRLFPFLPVAMGAGIIAYFAMNREPALGWWLAGGGALLAGATWAKGVGQAPLLLAAMVALGVADARFAAWRAPPWEALPRGAVVARGRVAAVEVLPEGRRVTLAEVSLDGAPAWRRGVRIRLRRGDGALPRAGDTLAVRALLRAPAGPAMPSGWDVRRDAYFSGMGAYGFAIGPAAVTPAGGGAWQRLREAIAARAMAALPGARGAIAATLLTGLGSAVPAADRQAFANAGLAHLLAVAGLHVGILMGLFYALARYGLAACEMVALRWNVAHVAVIVSWLAGGIYLALTGAHVPILRSFAMATLVVLAALTGRRAVSLRSWAIAALAVMLISPAAVMGVSFQMSFVAVLALVAGYEALRPWFAQAGSGLRHRIRRHVAGLVVTSVLAGTACLPFAAYHFGTITPFYVPANVLAVPLTALWVMPLCLAGLFLMPFGAEGLALVPAGWGISGLLWLARGVASWPDAEIAVAQIPGRAVLTVAAGMAWLGLVRGPARLGGLGAMAAGVAWMAIAPPPDVLVAPDARVIAARAGGQVFVEAARGAGRLERAAPARLWGEPGVAFPAEGVAAGGRVRCGPGWCDVATPGGQVRVLRDPGALAGACAGVGLLVAAFPLGSACPGVARIDRFTVADGAAAAWLQGAGVRMWQSGGGRPWGAVAGTVPALPMAATE